jgi:antitoxin HicB
MKEILLKIHLEELPEGVFLATSEELPGLIAQRRTIAETLEIAQDVASKLIESYKEFGDDLPPTLKEMRVTVADLHIPVSIA